MDEEKQILLQTALSYTESAVKEIRKVPDFDIPSFPKVSRKVTQLDLEGIYIDLVAIQEALKLMIQESQESKP